MDRQLYAENDMNTRQRTKYIHEGKHVAEVKVELIEDEQDWSPYLSKQDAYRLDEVRAAVKRGDLAAATKAAKVFSLTPVAVCQNSGVRSRFIALSYSNTRPFPPR